MNVDLLIRSLESAWNRRESAGLAAREGDTVLRLFYGPGEQSPADPLSCWAIDSYGAFLWMTEWEGDARPVDLRELKMASEQFYLTRGYRGAVVLRRPKQGVPEKPEMLWGEQPPPSYLVTERSGSAAMKFEIRLLEGRHPGLFLDHQPLRQWLATSGNLAQKSVLNTFAYTGSLSIAAWCGGAGSVTTLDLSRPTIQWAERNARINGIHESSTRFIAGDFFEQVPRLAKRGESFDVVISDPPSFSRGNKRSFSTQKDLVLLHEALLSVLRPGGLLITSINSANVPWEKYEREVYDAARSCGRRLKLLRRIEQPESFPSQPLSPKSHYLKGFIFET